MPSRPSSVLQRLQVLCAASISVMFLVDIGCLLPSNVHDGGLNVAETRRFYHRQLEAIPVATKLHLASDVMDGDLRADDGATIDAAVLEKATVLDGGVATEAAKVPEFYADNICELAEKAVTIRKEARYASRARGSLLLRIALFFRDLAVHGDGNFSFARLLVKRRKKMCEKSEVEGRCTVTQQAACGEVHASARRTNEHYDRHLGADGRPGADDDGVYDAITVGPDGKPIEKQDEELPDAVLGVLTGFRGFVAETALMYMASTLAVMLVFRCIGIVFGGLGWLMGAAGGRDAEKKTQ